MPHYGYSMMGWDGGVWMIFHAAFWLLLVATVVGLFLVPPKRIRRRDGSASTALALLDERYARGDIDREEYLQRKKDIVERAQPSAFNR